MRTGDEKTVWILGAGFSAPLGLPLAKDFFAERYVKLAEGYIAPWVVPPRAIQGFVSSSGGFQAAAIRLRQAEQAFQRASSAAKPKKLEWSTEAQMSWLRKELEPAKITSGRVRHVEKAARYYEDIEQFEAAALSFFQVVERLSGDEWSRETFIEAQQAQVQLNQWFRGPQQASGLLYSNGESLTSAFDVQRKEIAVELAKVRQVEAQEGWTAEQILVSLDLAANHNDIAQQRIWTKETDDGKATPHTREDPATYARDALRTITKLIVAEMEYAIPDTSDIDKAGYAWGPYVEWVKNLVGGDDTIMTFNYDRVVEKAFELTPGHSLGQNQLLKLHGSVTHGTDEDGNIKELQVAELHRQLRNPNEAFTVRLGLPGEAKSKIHGEGGPLKPLWDQAAEAIIGARHIVFIGYSLPPEDVEAMEMIVEAIRERRESDRTSALTIHLVLGPGTKDAEILESILTPYDVTVENTKSYTQHAFVNWPKTGYPQFFQGLADPGRRRARGI